MRINNFQSTVKAIAILLASSLALHSQSTVSTPIVGFQTIAIVPGLNAIAPSLLNSDVLKASVASVSSSNIISISGESNVGSKLTTGEPYYIEVYSGSEKGARFEVDVASTISAANSTILLQASSSRNSRALTLASLVNSTIALRKHFTIEQLQNSLVSGSGTWVGNNTFTSADQILLLDPNTQGFSTYFLRLDGVTWRNTSTGTTVQNKAPIPPGTGVFVQKRNAGLSLQVAGGVRQNDFDQPYKAGLQLLAPAAPMDLSPAQLGASAANGWTGNNTFTSADQIQVFNSGSQSFSTYFLRLDGATWRGTATGTTAQTSNNIIPSDRAYLVKRNTADSTTVLVNPIAN